METLINGVGFFATGILLGAMLFFSGVMALLIFTVLEPDVAGRFIRQVSIVVISDPSRPDNPMIYVSEEFETQTGYPPEEVLGRNCRFLQGPETDPEAVQAIRDALAAQTEITIDILNYRKDGTNCGSVKSLITAIKSL